ncbi:MAG TPA: LuxR C-terminal-related transcriptional regulator [Candidatus Limnocylindria bacterium]|nr:LuxR C-terminal-related transcriptional regulator [Candidatus Limnocylindria bacterium]
MSAASSDRRRAQPGRRLADLWLQLTPRQRRVLDLVAAGSSNKEIATQLGTSEQAAKQHVSKLLSRFGVESRTALAQSALAIRITGQRDSDLPLEYLFDLAPVAMAMTSGPDHVFRAINHAFSELFGDREGWIGYRLRELLTEPEAALLPLVDAVYQSGGGVQRVGVPVRLTGPAGPIQRSLTITVEPTRTAAGAVGGLVFFGIDVTEEVQLRERLQSAEAERQAIVQQLPGGIGLVVLHADGRVAAMTGSIMELIGGSLDPAVPLASQTPRYAMRWADTGVPLGPADSPSVRALAGEEVAADLVGRALPDGPEYRMRVSARPIRGAHGKITGAVMVFERLTPL